MDYHTLTGETVPLSVVMHMLDRRPRNGRTSMYVVNAGCREKLSRFNGGPFLWKFSNV